MADNFDTHKWFKDQYLAEIEDKSLNPQYIDNSVINAMEGIDLENTRTSTLREIKESLRILTTEWLDKGYTKEDVIWYFSKFIKNI